MAEFASIRAKIFAILKTMSSVTSTNVQDSGGGEPDGFPWVTLEIMGNDSEVGDQRTNLRTYKFRVRIYIDAEREQGGQATAEDTLAIVLDEIVDLFDADPTLGGTVQDLTPLVAETGYATLKNGLTRTAEIELMVKQCFQFT